MTLPPLVGKQGGRIATPCRSRTPYIRGCKQGGRIATPCRRTYIRGCKQGGRVAVLEDEGTTDAHPPPSPSRPNSSSLCNSRQHSSTSFSIQIYLDVKTSTALFANFQGGKLNQTFEMSSWGKFLRATLKKHFESTLKAL